MTSQQIEAIKMALEALEKLWSIIDDIDTYGDMAKADDKSYRALVERRQRMRFKETGITTDGYKLSGGAITALKEVLEEHAMRETQRLGQEIEQERLWVGLNDDEIYYLIHLAYTGDEEFVQIIEAKLKEKNLPCIKPKWIGLTEKEHTDIAVECGCMSADWVFYGAAVERKVKERNT